MPEQRCQSNQVRFSGTEQGSEEGDPRIVRETSHRKSTRLPSRERVLLHLLHGSQKGRRIPTHTEPKKSQYTPKSPTLQNGDISFNPTSTESGGLGYYLRPKGCLFSRPYFSKPQEIPEICLQKHPLPIPSTTFWDRRSATNIHENINRTSRVLSQPTGTHLHVSGRLDCREPGARSARRAIGANIGDVGYGRTYPEYQERRT